MGNNIVFNIRCLVLMVTDNKSRIGSCSSFLVLVSMLLAGCNTMTAADDSVSPSTVDSSMAASPAADKAAPSPDQAKAPEPAKTESEPSSDMADADAADSIIKKPASLDSDTLFNLLAAEFAGNAGDVDASLSYYREASKSIEDSRIAARSAYIAIYGKNYEEALKALDRWSVLEPEAEELTKLYAVTYLHLHQPEKSVPYIEKLLLDIHDSSSDQAIAVKQLLAKESNTQDAYIVLKILNEQAVDGRQGHTENKHLLVLQSRYAAELKKFDESIALLDEVMIIDPSLTEVLILKARVLSVQGKDAEAVLLVKQVVDEYPDNITLRLQYARMLIEQHKLTEATEQYFILYESAPDDEDIAFSLALIYIETQKLDAAEDVLKHLVDIDKKTAVANYYLGRIAQNRGDEKQAVSYYLKVQRGEYKFDSQLRIGVLLAMLGKPNEGLIKLEALAEEQSSWELRVKSYLAQGEILRSQQRYKEGVEMYSRALQYNNDDTNLLYARGLMAEKVDRLDMAEADLLKVINKEPENANALNALGYTLADRTARYEEALDYISRAAELVPDDPAILDSLGWVSFRLGKMDDAIKFLSRAFAKLEDAEIAAHYGEVLWINNQKDKAREIWEKGRATNDKNPVLLETLDRLKP